MRKTILFALITLLCISSAYAQVLSRYEEVPATLYTTAFKVERLKKADCTFISYSLSAPNITVTPRDDRHVGVYYFVSGKDCTACFEEEFRKMNFQDEEYMPIASETLVLSENEKISLSISIDQLAQGETRLYRTYLFNDNATSMPKDDIYLGSDFVIESANPEAISMPLDLSFIADEFPDVAFKKELFASHDYYKLREMQANRNNIIARLRDANRLKDITPQNDITYVKLKKARK